MGRALAVRCVRDAPHRTGLEEIVAHLAVGPLGDAVALVEDQLPPQLVLRRVRRVPLQDREADRVGVAAAVAARLPRVGDAELDHELRRRPVDLQQPLVVVPPRDEVGAAARRHVHPPALDGEARPQVVEHPAHVHFVEVAAEVGVRHPERAVVRLAAVSEVLAQPAVPLGGAIRPLPRPLDRVAVVVERDAQLHQAVLLELAAGDHRVRAVEEDPLPRRLRPRLPLCAVLAADHVVRLHLLHHLLPQLLGNAPLREDPIGVLRLLQVELVADAAGQILEPLRHRRRRHPVVAAEVLCERLLDDHRPEDVVVLWRGRGAGGELWGAMRCACEAPCPRRVPSYRMSRQIRK